MNINFNFRILASFDHLYQENPDFPVGKSKIPGPTFGSNLEASKVGSWYVQAGLPKVIGTPTVESK